VLLFSIHVSSNTAAVTGHVHYIQQPVSGSRAWLGTAPAALALTQQNSGAPAMASICRRGLTRNEFTEATQNQGADPSNWEGNLGVQVYIQNKIATVAEDVQQVCTVPSDQNWDSGVWQLEHLRQVVLELSELLVALAVECTAGNCGKMKATNEWVFLCAAHKNPRECCAIDYIIHNLEATSAVLNSRRWFPNRGSVPDTAGKMFQSIARRLYRIFAHVFYHHRHIFDEFERTRHLYQRFMYLVHTYDWIVEKLCIIPPEVLDTPATQDA